MADESAINNLVAQLRKISNEIGAIGLAGQQKSG
jgi:hypothetical protein